MRAAILEVAAGEQATRHRVDYFEREADIRRIYAGEPDALDLLKRYNVDFIVVSPMERNQLAVNDRFIDQFPVIGRSGDYTLYEVPKAQG